MAFKIGQNYRKDALYAINHGYSKRPVGTKPLSIAVHTTNGNKGSSFSAECRFLRDSRAVSCGYVVGKAGQIEQILPDELCSWHAGQTYAPFWNETSIGIECHHAIGEQWTEAQVAALTWLCQSLITKWGILKDHLETHRAIALPKGRKVDPSGWSDTDFYTWRDRLYQPANEDRSVIGVAPSISLATFVAALKDHQAPLSATEMSRIYDLCRWLDIDPNFFVHLWMAESGSPLGGSVLQQQTHCPINIKTFLWEGRDSVAYNAANWAAYESFQLGAFESLIHLKQVHGAHGRHTVRSIIPVHAPQTDNNDPERMISAILGGMHWTETNR